VRASQLCLEALAISSDENKGLQPHAKMNGRDQRPLLVEGAKKWALPTEEATGQRAVALEVEVIGLPRAGRLTVDRSPPRSRGGNVTPAVSRGQAPSRRHTS
jgi:hypothetical protein